MNYQKNASSDSNRIGRIAVYLLGTVIILCMAFVLIFDYTPSQNALRALASVSMDVISILVLLILIFGIIGEREKLTKTTKLFLGLMIATVWGLFWDFLTWSSDGSLDFANYTIFFTVASLCMGSVVAGIYVLYIFSYMDDMYGMKNTSIRGKICLGLNIFSCAVTLGLAIAQKAFEFNDGHYEVGALYDVVTIIPILSVFYVTFYSIRYVKVIGVHDLLAAVGYNLTMIIGALIESEFSIGTTYVGIAIADVFLFIMLQNKLLSRVKKQKKLLDEKIASQFQILESMAGIYSYVNYIDLEQMTARRFDIQDNITEPLDVSDDSHSYLNKILLPGIEDDLKDKFWDYTNLSTLSFRMQGDKIISADFCHKEDGWFRAQYIRIGNSVDEPVKQVIYAIRNIDEEKKNVEKWIRRSRTDDMTGLFNRYAYEKEIASLIREQIPDNFVYVSIDVNSLKVINDALGHEAGDELIVGACDCMRRCFGQYGNLYRIGGDEFVALIYASDEQVEQIMNSVDEITTNWHGRFVKELSLACGFVSRSEVPDMSLHQMAVLADKRMYEAKTMYYRKKGIDRRGRKDAHVALCDLYSKILRINVTEDTYQIVDVNSNEQKLMDNAPDKISEWLRDFGHSGRVHPDDMEDFLAKTDLNYISEYFKSGRKSLTIFYHKEYDDGMKLTMMEMIPANDYTDESQNLFLYVKNIEQ